MDELTQHNSVEMHECHGHKNKQLIDLTQHNSVEMQECHGQKKKHVSRETDENEPSRDAVRMAKKRKLLKEGVIPTKKIPVSSRERTAKCRARKREAEKREMAKEKGLKKEDEEGKEEAKEEQEELAKEAKEEQEKLEIEEQEELEIEEKEEQEELEIEERDEQEEPDMVSQKIALLERDYINILQELMDMRFWIHDKWSILSEEYNKEELRKWVLKQNNSFNEALNNAMLESFQEVSLLKEYHNGELQMKLLEVKLNLLTNVLEREHGKKDKEWEEMTFKSYDSSHLHEKVTT